MTPQNKLNIISAEQLADAEERMGKLRVREMYDSGRFAAIPIGTFASLCEIHESLLGDIYDHAGELRTVDIARGNVRYTPVEGLLSAVKFVDIMPQGSFDEIIDKYVEMDTAHPFRSGNGRALRIWLDLMLSDALGVMTDWTRVDRQAYLDVMKNAAIDPAPLARLINAALISDESRLAFLRAVDASFAIDGYSRYRTELL